MRTPVENLERWIAALRSGKYEQGLGRLRRDEEFCCLGVACDVFDNAAWETGDFFGGLICTPPLVVERAFCLDEDGFNDVETLVKMNDGGASFAQIADFIEQTILPRVRSEQEKVQS